MANIFVAAAATWNGKALKKAKQDVSFFDKQVKTLTKTFAAAFSVTAINRFAKASVKAFIADEKAAKSLEQQLKNTGYQFSAPGVELYIANLQKATGVLDDELRPAFQQILTVTGSIIKSQEALNTALNVSAATGKSVTEVSAALAKGFAGQTTALARLGAGLNKATLKTGDMDKILGELNDKFAGQAQARLSTYAGKMDLLKVASENAKEEIGKGLLAALDALGQNTSIDATTAKMERLGKTTGQTIEGIGVLLGELGKIPGSRGFTDVVFGTNIFSLLSKLSAENKKGQFPTGAARETPATGRILAAQRKQEAKALKESTALRKQEVTQLKAKTAVDKLKDQFDLERIGLNKALNEATDAETKLRLKAQIAILDNNEAMAKKLLAELEAAKSLKDLAEAARKAAEAWGTFDPAKFRMGENKDLGNDIAQLLAALAAMQGLSAAMLPKSLGSRTTQAAETLAYGQRYSDVNVGTLGGSIFDPSFFRQGENKDLTITIDTTATGDRFAALIAESLQIAQKSGVSYGIAGGL